jgi:hypothetical protein
MYSNIIFRKRMNSLKPYCSSEQNIQFLSQSKLRFRRKVIHLTRVYAVRAVIAEMIALFRTFANILNSTKIYENLL